MKKYVYSRRRGWGGHLVDVITDSRKHEKILTCFPLGYANVKKSTLTSNEFFNSLFQEISFLINNLITRSSFIRTLINQILVFFQARNSFFKGIITVRKQELSKLLIFKHFN